MTRKRLYLLMGTVCLILCAVCLILFLPKRGPAKPPAVRQATLQVAERGSAHTAAYESPIDFRVLKNVNEDIYAWLYIPGTEINHPVLQSPSGDYDYYLTHTVDRLEDENGCLFTEYQYNGTDFTDPVTVIYGYRRRSGDMFGQLQKIYSENNALDTYREIIVYAPEKELRYEVFGASEYTKLHIPYAYSHFTDPDSIPQFVRTLRNYHTMNRQFDDSVTVSGDDRLLVLSTCLSQNQDQRFLVLARLVEEIR